MRKPPSLSLPIPHRHWSVVSPSRTSPVPLQTYLLCIILEKKWNHTRTSFCEPHLSLTSVGEHLPAPQHKSTVFFLIAA